MITEQSDDYDVITKKAGEPDKLRFTCFFYILLIV